MTNPSYLDPTEPMVRMWKIMAENGMSMTVLGQFFALGAREKKIPLDLLKYVFGPIVVHTRHGERENRGLGWIDDDMLARWRPRIFIERIEILCGERPDLVSPAEIALVMINATYERPLPYQAQQIYCWAVLRAARAIKLATKLEDALSNDQVMRMPTDDEIFDGYLTHEYRSLGREIIRKVVSHSQIRAQLTRQ